MSCRRPSMWWPLAVLAAVVLLASRVTCDDNEPPRFRGSGRKDKLLVILLDGFRWDYADKHGMKSFAKIKDIGVAAEYSNPVFPAMSYPNYYSLATGLYVENHGMVMNYMYDPERDKRFLMMEEGNATQSFWFEEAEPIWVTATKKAKRSILYRWPGGNLAIHGVKALASEPYVFDADLRKFRQYLDDSLVKFRHNHADLAMVYCEYTDYIGHTYGPESKDMKDALDNLDKELEILQERINNYELRDKLNVIIVSDHGMTATDKKSVKRISLDSLIEFHMVQLILGYGAVVGIFPKYGYTEKLYHELSKSKDIRVWKKEDLPEKFHAKNNKRTPSIIVLAKKGVFISPVKQFSEQVPYFHTQSTKEYKGFHGYDVEEVSDMRGIFYGFGPGFEEREVHPGVNIVDVYNIMMHMLDLEPLPNNGSWTSVYKMVKSQNSATSLWSHGYLTLLTCTGGIFVYSFMAYYNSLWY